MCKEFNTLIEQNDWRYTAQCEHSTVHLRWGNITLSLQPNDFTLLTHQVCQAFYSSHQQGRRMRVNIGQTTLEFPASDWQSLVQLMQQTVEKLTVNPEFSHKTSRPAVKLLQPWLGLPKQYLN